MNSCLRLLISTLRHATYRLMLAGMEVRTPLIKKGRSLTAVNWQLDLFGPRAQYRDNTCYLGGREEVAKTRPRWIVFT